MKANQDWSRRGFMTGIGAAMVCLPGCRERQAAEHESEQEVIPRVVDDGVYEWRGLGFGIEMSMELHGVVEAAGGAFGARSERIIAMLEKAFSLYLEDSELSRLNRERVLASPSPLFTDLLDRARVLEGRTLGYFQPAIHGAWQWLTANGFKITDEQGWGQQCEAARAEFIERSDDGSIRFSHPLTQLSMNAIAQGYLADLVGRLIKDAGVEHALLHLGETVAIGAHPSGRRWKLAVRGTGEVPELVGEMHLMNQGLAVSANEPGRWLIDPVAGRLVAEPRVAAVVSDEGAAVADAFATAFAVAPPGKREELARRLMQGGDCQVSIWQDNRLVFSA